MRSACVGRTRNHIECHRWRWNCVRRVRYYNYTRNYTHNLSSAHKRRTRMVCGGFGSSSKEYRRSSRDNVQRVYCMWLAYVFIIIFRLRLRHGERIYTQAELLTNLLCFQLGCAWSHFATELVQIHTHDVFLQTFSATTDAQKWLQKPARLWIYFHPFIRRFEMRYIAVARERTMKSIHCRTKAFNQLKIRSLKAIKNTSINAAAVGWAVCRSYHTYLLARI